MKISINHFSLSAGGEESPAGLQIDGRREVQIAPLLRGANAAVFARGNRVQTITFAVTREHATHGAAESFLFAHAATVPASGTAVFLCEDTDGAQVQYTAAASVVASDQGTQRGITTTHQYTLVCGEISGGQLRLG